MTAKITNQSAEAEQNDQQKAVGKFGNVNNISAKFGMLGIFIPLPKYGTHFPKLPTVRTNVEIPTNKIKPKTYR